MKPNLSKILKELRSSNSKTQREIAEYLGITRQAYSRYESSMREPSMDTLARLAEYYDVSPQIFFVGKIDQPITEDMDIVELSALYQAKKVVYQNKDKKQDKNNETVIEHTEEIEDMKKALYSKLDLSFPPGHIVIKKDGEQIEKKKITIDKVKKYVLYLLILLSLVNVSIMTIHRMDPSYDYPTFKHSYISAITPDQNISATMYTGIVRITEFNALEAEVGDKIVVYSDFGVDDYWVQEITSIDRESGTVSTTYDFITAKTIEYDEVLGEYDDVAGIIGTLYYTAKFNTGFLFITTGHVLLLAFYYYTFVDKNGQYA